MNGSFRKYFGPVQMYPLFQWKRVIFLVIRFIGLVLFSLVWPIVHSYPVTTVTENASQFSKCFPRLLSTFNSRLRVNGRKRWFSNTMVSYIIYHENYACSVREYYLLSIVFLNCVDGRKLWIRYMWKRIFQGAGIKFPFSKTHSFFFYQNIFYKIIEAEICKILRLL